MDRREIKSTRNKGKKGVQVEFPGAGEQRGAMGELQ